MIFGFSVKNCLKISYYIFDLENLASQCNNSIQHNPFMVTKIAIKFQ